MIGKNRQEQQESQGEDDQAVDLIGDAVIPAGLRLAGLAFRLTFFEKAK